MLIIKIVAFCFVALFLYLLLKDVKSDLSILLLIVAGVSLFLFLMPYINDLIEFIKSIAEKANIETLYIGIVLKILAIAYLTSFCSEICKIQEPQVLHLKLNFLEKY